MTRVMKGALIEYALAVPPLMLEFEFNPQSITRTRSITVKTGGSPGTRGGYDFTSPTETPRASQGVTVNSESFTVKILLDATDRMNVGDAKGALATLHGIQPELDTIRCMIEPKSQSPSGAQMLAALGQGKSKAVFRHESASVLLFVWGAHILPVFMTQAQVEEKAYLPSLIPYRAEATLTLQVIESSNPFYRAELARQTASAALNSVEMSISAIGGMF